METAESTTQKPASRPADGRAWRSFPKVPNLLQYASTGLYYARVQVNGKNIRTSLKTKVWSTAKLRLRDFLNAQIRAPRNVESVAFTQAVETFKAELKNETSLKESSKQFRLWCIATLRNHWPELWQRNIDTITPEDCKAWAARVHPQVSAQYYNNLLGTLKLILATGIALHLRQGGNPQANPARELPLARIRKKDLTLPEGGDFQRLVKKLAENGGTQGQQLAQQLEFLAYSGMRAFSEAAWVTWDDIDFEREEIVVRGDPQTGTKNSEIRRIPLIADMRQLLDRLRPATPPTGSVMKIRRCEVRLRQACKETGIPAITLHDLRHLFATRCIESGVDIPTVSRWLGHKDGGTLAMKTYGHLRNEHSKAMAKRVRF